MRQLLKFTLVAIFLFSGAGVFAQKFGHINSQELLQMMPEKDNIQQQIAARTAEHEKTSKEMQVEFQKLMEDFEKTAETLSDAARATKQQALQDLDNRFKTFQQYAGKDLQDLQQKLLQPVIEKARKAINDVGTENGFTYIFDMSTGIILFNSADAVDVLPLVKAKLGIQ